MRWLPDYDRRHTGAGALVAVAAPPAAWPNPPQPAAVQLVSIDAEGNPAPDRPADTGGLDKRTLGARDGAVVLLGNPSLAVAVAPVEVAEGLADALALAARADAPAIATLGTGEMVSGNLAHWLADASRVRVYADRDAAKDGRWSQPVATPTRYTRRTPTRTPPPWDSRPWPMAGTNTRKPLPKQRTGRAGRSRGWPP